MTTLRHISFIRTTLAAALFVALSPSALAGSFGSWGSFGGWGSSGSCGSYGSHARYPTYVSYGSSGSYGGYRAVSYRTYGYGSYGSSGSYGGTYYHRQPAEVAPELPPPPPTPESEAPPQATIRMTVPADARVFVDGRETASTGVERRFAARDLRDGHAYAYRLRVEFDRDGEKVVENRLVPVKAGDAVELEFGDSLQPANSQAATTQLTVRVPERAKVMLAGTSTNQTGELRTFSTAALAAGTTWENYVVRVEVEEEGQTRVKEQPLTLVGGEKYELTFDFADESATFAALD
jgi:uncharacterized protein (TIGR03000 family)